MTGRRRLLAGAAAATLLAATHPARADRLCSLLVGAPAGSTPDLQACTFAPFLERHLPQTRVGVRDEAGEAGLAALRLLAAAPPDATLLGWVSTPALPARMIDRQGGALIDKLVLLGAVQAEPVVLVAGPASGVASMPALLRASAAGGGSVPLGTPPAGSPGHLAALRLQAAARVQLDIIAFPTAGAARQAALAGNVRAALLSLGEARDALIDGRLRGLAVATPDRLPDFPDIATMAESGQRITALVRRGLAAPAGMDPALAAQLTRALQEVVADPEFRQLGRDSGFAPILLDGPSWLQAVRAEQQDLQALWQAAPWLVLNAG